MNPTDLLEKVQTILLEELIKRARKDPEVARKLFRETLKELKETCKSTEFDLDHLGHLTTILMNLLPEETAHGVKVASNRQMVAHLQASMESFADKPVGFFAYEEKPCDCPVCQANDRKIHLAN